MRTFLRNGEILLGPVAANALQLRTNDGVTVRLQPSSVHVLVRPKHGDGKGVAPEKAVAYLETHDGERLALAPQEGLCIPAALPWGTAELPLDRIQCLTYVRNGQPGYRVALANGSRLRVLLRGDALTMRTLRFGPLSVYPQAIARVVAVKRPKRKASSETDQPAGETDADLPAAMAKTLETKVTLQYDDTPMAEALAQFQKQAGVPTRLAETPSGEAATDRIRLTLEVKDMVARKALAWIKELSGLDYVADENQIVFRSGDASPSEAAGDEAEGTGTEIRAPHFRRAGDNRLVGSFAQEKLTLITMNGPMTIQAPQLKGLARRQADDAKRWPFAVSLKDGSSLKGRMTNPVIVARALDAVYRIPLQHVEAFVNPEPRPAPLAAEGPAADGGPPADW
jgi:hypothetical protein